MTTHDEASGLVLRMLECFNTRQFDEADELFTSSFVTHPFGTGPEQGKQAWRQLVAKFPDIQVVAEDILLAGDKVTVRSSIEGTETTSVAAQPILIEVFRIQDGRLAEWWGSTWLPDLS
jgi:predicted SnoaL-like aldol condensation-catalyzing enzyme